MPKGPRAAFKQFVIADRVGRRGENLYSGFAVAGSRAYGGQRIEVLEE
jgi:hypothetical protein